MTRNAWIAAAAVSALLPVGAAQAQTPFDWTGFYVGVHGGFIDGQVTIDGGMGVGDVSGFVGGALAGRNFARMPGSPYQWGVEGDFGWINAQGYGAGGGDPDGCRDYLYDLNWDAHLRGRVGLPAGSIMPFIAAGLAFADLGLRDTCEEEQGEGGLFVGGTVGGGVDFKLSPNLIGRGEFLYDFYGTKQYEYFSASFNAWTIRAALTWLLP